MKRKILVLLIVGLSLTATYWFFLRKKDKEDVKVLPLNIQKHSNAFNASVAKVTDTYLVLKDAFVESDTNLIRIKTNEFIDALNTIDTTELKKDTTSVFETVMATINDIRMNAESINHQTSISEMRKDFSSLTDMMFPSFFYAIKYEGPTLYLQNCPMAIEDSIPANWISKSNEIVNPYLGKTHPVYKGTMLHCGEVKDSIIAE